jgi:hypothetical protein
MTEPYVVIKHTKIVFKDEEHPESKSQFILLNDRGLAVKKCKIDGEGGLFNDVTFKKCDWLAVIGGLSLANACDSVGLYIELKSGHGVKEGAEQIMATLKKIAESHERQALLNGCKKSVKIGYIIHSAKKSPITGTAEQKLVKTALRTRQLILRFEKTPYETTIKALTDNTPISLPIA